MTDQSPSEAADPNHRHPDTREALRTALLDLAKTARRELLVCSPTLDPALFNGAAMSEALTHLVARHPYNRVRIVVEDTEHMLMTCIRLVELARRLSDLVLIRRLGEPHHGLSEQLAVADGESCLYQQDVGMVDATLDLHAPRLAQPLTRRFEDIWAASEPVPGLHGFRL